MLRNDIELIQNRGLYYIANAGGKPRRFKPWLGDYFAFLYDTIMEKSIFPKKFAAGEIRHCDMLRQELQTVRGKRVLELGTGTGSAVRFLDNDNIYIGTDISTGLLKKAVKRFHSAGFKNAEFYVTGAEELPFADQAFDLCLCILSFNFFDDQENVLQEVHRVLASGGRFLCTVPVPERIKSASTIRGKLHSEQELKQLVQNKGFSFESLAGDNGALLYFRGIKKEV